MKRKITLSTLEELSGVISHQELENYFGGGSGTSYRDPYTFIEYMSLGWSFQKGHSAISGYQGYISPDYEYDWEKMFRMMGIPTY